MVKKNKPRSTGKSQRDWADLKRQFMAGEWVEVADFNRQVLGIKSGSNTWSRLKQNGWGEEKKKRKEKAAEKAIDKAMQDSAEIAETALKTLMINIAEQAKNGDLSAADKKLLWSMLRVETNRPTTITAGEMKQKISIEEEPTIIPKF